MLNIFIGINQVSRQGPHPHKWSGPPFNKENFKAVLMVAKDYTIDGNTELKKFVVGYLVIRNCKLGFLTLGNRAYSLFSHDSD